MKHNGPNQSHPCAFPPNPRPANAPLVLRGRVKLIAEHNGETWDVEASDRDLIPWPVGVCRDVVNIGDEEALMRVIVGTPKPTNPTYPSAHALSTVKR